MIINNKQYRSIWMSEDKLSIEIIDQRYLPFEFIIETINSSTEMAEAIRDMRLRGAPLIGVAAAYGMYLAALEASRKPDFNQHLKFSEILLLNTRPTAVNLKWAIDRVREEIDKARTIEEIISNVYKIAEKIADEDVENCKSIGKYGVEIIEDISLKKKGDTVNILTHCNAGALACVDYGTALSPITEAFKKGIKLRVWVDETRPRLQGKLTSWELEQLSIPNTVISDNAGGYLMQKGMVDLVIVGADRIAQNGDVANKIGTYLKALAAKDSGIPFYVAAPTSTIDFNLQTGNDIIIEKRDENEVLYAEGLLNGKIESVRLFSSKAQAENYGFDVTPHKLISGYITEKGIYARIASII
ncbi:MAG TPA: S-methyl-5-thioribose-1-phosphate isomerase [Spirochaetota bacterium]|nr:S-methyl-5-thioribose-1-phosphate isomerase [Spirochaetota bacterium]HOS32861.1 S-methyl-5-thioribose-1-phosphate isomerase [Spirochaetota bacterium]HOS55308.1 S-methyl-5-thioribose-1-phosphate isomerase [Spirochaetota bacterium]HQF76909.1 S-methyl-5-thioribose-1-phosphate isomerase [Spirochaetota bacterium]HQH31853.1 S-methyl-5-thioribose-1-phosphate isomerase [Spirochaetota bacterium]